jgi:hypothetical protein
MSVEFHENVFVTQQCSVKAQGDEGAFPLRTHVCANYSFVLALIGRSSKNFRIFKGGISEETETSIS